MCIIKEFTDINPKNSSTRHIFPRVLNTSPEATAIVLQNLLNLSVETDVFPDNLKLADITPVFKKEDPLDETNYCPVSLPPIVSKLFEKIMQNQINGVRGHAFMMSTKID